MQVQIDIGFNELVRIVKALPANQLRELRAEMDKDLSPQQPQSDLEILLLNGPVATDEQLDIISNNRKAIDQWRIR